MGQWRVARKEWRWNWGRDRSDRALDGRDRRDEPFGVVEARVDGTFDPA